MNRLTVSLAVVVALLASSVSVAKDTAFNHFASVAQLQQRMQSGQLDSAQLMKTFIQRIQRIDQSGPTLKSVLQINPQALSIAKSLDNQRGKAKREPLYGIPVLLKDNIDTGDQMLTTAGSLALMEAPAPQDAGLVARLRKGGAVILGKANLSEWANMRSNHASSGWSGRGG